MAYTPLDLVKRSELARVLTNAEMDGNLTALETYINAILAGTANYEAGNALKLGGSTAAQILATPAWTNATMTNSWVEYASTDKPRYTKTATGIVCLDGLAKSGTVGAAMFTLPVGYRPNQTQRFCVISNDAIGKLVVGTDGTVTLTNGSNVYASLSGLMFNTAS